MKVELKIPLTASDKLNTNFPFEIDLLSKNKPLLKSVNTGSPQCHNYFEIIFVVQGRGSLKVDMQECEVNKNEIYCIYPGQIYVLSPSRNDKLMGYSMKFKKSFIDKGHHHFDLTYSSSLLQLFATRQGIPIKAELSNNLEELIFKMMEELKTPDPLKIEILRNYLEIFLIQITRQYHSSFLYKSKTKNMELVESFLNLLEKNFKEKKMVADYASDLCITPNYLNEIVKKTIGSSAGYQIRQRITLEAKRQALYSRLGMKEVAYFLGFSDPSHFSKFFKNETGENFSNFKQQNAVTSLLEAV